MPARRIPLLLFGAFFALYFIWGSTYLAIRFGVESWPPMLMAGVRFVIAGGLMFAWLRWRGAPLPTWREWRGAGIVGILLLSCGNGGVTVAEHWGVSSGVAALAVATVPLFTLLFSQLFGQRNTTLEWGGIVLGLFGIVLLNLGSNLQASPAGAGDPVRRRVLGLRLGVEPAPVAAGRTDGQRRGNAGRRRGAAGRQSGQR